MLTGELSQGFAVYRKTLVLIWVRDIELITFLSRQSFKSVSEKEKPGSFWKRDRQINEQNA